MGMENCIKGPVGAQYLAPPQGSPFKEFHIINPCNPFK